jgi:hypothetical protein
MPVGHRLSRAAPTWGRLSTILFVVCALAAPVAAQPKKPGGDATKTPAGTPAAAPADPKADNKGDKKKDAGGGGGTKEKVKNFDFNALDLNGRMRTPQLLYFLERANEELERASLEKRSFIPHMVRSVEEEQL